MIKYIKELIIDFIEFRRIRRLNRLIELKPVHKHLLHSYTKEREIELNSLILLKLSEMMVNDDISPEYKRGFRSALTQRIALLGIANTKFPIIKE